MKNFLLAIVLCTMIVLTFSACAVNVTKLVGDTLLQPPSLYAIYQTSPKNLSELSQCQSTPPSVNIVNVETRSNIHNIFSLPGASIYIIPNEFNNYIVNYIRDAFQKSQINVDENSTKIIQISLNYAQSLRSGASLNEGAELRLNISIPEKQYTETVKAEDWTPRGQAVAMAYAIHVATWKIIENPVILDYILCR